MELLDINRYLDEMMSGVGGMNQLTRSLDVEWAPDKIRVNCVTSGTVVTDMAKQVRMYL
jgi:NAD(P)-dependent dehydrogenase (short-subunit alcohol dehydrogenase family)